MEYRLAAKLGDELKVNTAYGEEGFYVVLTDAQKSPYAIVRFREPGDTILENKK